MSSTTSSVKMTNLVSVLTLAIVVTCRSSPVLGKAGAYDWTIWTSPKVIPVTTTPPPLAPQSIVPAGLENSPWMTWVNKLTNLAGPEETQNSLPSAASLSSLSPEQLTSILSKMSPSSATSLPGKNSPELLPVPGSQDSPSGTLPNPASPISNAVAQNSPTLTATSSAAESISTPEEILAQLMKIANIPTASAQVATPKESQANTLVVPAGQDTNAVSRVSLSSGVVDQPPETPYISASSSLAPAEKIALPDSEMIIQLLQTYPNLKQFLTAAEETPVPVAPASDSSLVSTSVPANTTSTSVIGPNLAETPPAPVASQESSTEDLLLQLLKTKGISLPASLKNEKAPVGVVESNNVVPPVKGDTEISLEKLGLPPSIISKLIEALQPVATEVPKEAVDKVSVPVKESTVAIPESLSATTLPQSLDLTSDISEADKWKLFLAGKVPEVTPSQIKISAPPSLPQAAVAAAEAPWLAWIKSKSPVPAVENVLPLPTAKLVSTEAAKVVAPPPEVAAVTPTTEALWTKWLKLQSPKLNGTVTPPPSPQPPVAVKLPSGPLTVATKPVETLKPAATLEKISAIEKVIPEDVLTQWLKLNTPAALRPTELPPVSTLDTIAASEESTLPPSKVAAAVGDATTPQGLTLDDVWAQLVNLNTPTTVVPPPGIAAVSTLIPPAASPAKPTNATIAQTTTLTPDDILAQWLKLYLPAEIKPTSTVVPGISAVATPPELKPINVSVLKPVTGTLTSDDILAQWLKLNLPAEIKPASTVVPGIPAVATPPELKPINVSVLKPVTGTLTSDDILAQWLKLNIPGAVLLPKNTPLPIPAKPVVPQLRPATKPIAATKITTDDLLAEWIKLNTPAKPLPLGVTPLPIPVKPVIPQSPPTILTPKPIAPTKLTADDVLAQWIKINFPDAILPAEIKPTLLPISPASESVATLQVIKPINVSISPEVAQVLTPDILAQWMKLPAPAILNEIKPVSIPADSVAPKLPSVDSPLEPKPISIPETASKAVAPDAILAQLLNLYKPATVVSPELPVAAPVISVLPESMVPKPNTNVSLIPPAGKIIPAPTNEIPEALWTKWLKLNTPPAPSVIPTTSVVTPVKNVSLDTPVVGPPAIPPYVAPPVFPTPESVSVEDFWTQWLKLNAPESLEPQEVAPIPDKNILVTLKPAVPTEPITSIENSESTEIPGTISPEMWTEWLKLNVPAAPVPAPAIPAATLPVPVIPAAPVPAPVIPAAPLPASEIPSAPVTAPVAAPVIPAGPLPVPVIPSAPLPASVIPSAPVTAPVAAPVIPAGPLPAPVPAAPVYALAPPVSVPAAPPVSTLLPSSVPVAPAILPPWAPWLKLKTGIPPAPLSQIPVVPSAPLPENPWITWMKLSAPPAAFISPSLELTQTTLSPVAEEKETTALPETIWASWLKPTLPLTPTEEIPIPVEGEYVISPAESLKLKTLEVPADQKLPTSQVISPDNITAKLVPASPESRIPIPVGLPETFWTELMKLSPPPASNKTTSPKIVVPVVPEKLLVNPWIEYLEKLDLLVTTPAPHVTASSLSAESASVAPFLPKPLNKTSTTFTSLDNISCCEWLAKYLPPDVLNATLAKLKQTRRSVNPESHHSHSSEENSSEESNLKRALTASQLGASDSGVATPETKLNIVPPGFWTVATTPAPSSSVLSSFVDPAFWAAKKAMFISNLFSALAKVAMNATEETPASDIVPQQTLDGQIPAQLQPTSAKLLTNNVARSASSDESSSEKESSVVQKRKTKTKTKTKSSDLKHKLPFLSDKVKSKIASKISSKQGAKKTEKGKSTKNKDKASHHSHHHHHHSNSKHHNSVKKSSESSTSTPPKTDKSTTTAKTTIPTTTDDPVDFASLAKALLVEN